MELIFIAPSTRHPSGGVAVVYEFAMSMAKRGHRVHLFHVGFYQANAFSLSDIDWFSFSGDVVHHFPPEPIDHESIPAADFIFGFTSEETLPPQVGLPVVLIQGYKMLEGAGEELAFRAPCPKICVARWLVDVGERMGVPALQLVHVPPGLPHEKFTVRRPIDERPPMVSFCYSPHVNKGADLALDAIRKAKAAVPELEATAFGAVPPECEFPAWITYRTNPSQRDLVDLYNNCRIFVCASEVEGFGLTNVEAMACGAALVTTDNGGSRDYAEHDRTALVAPTGDSDMLAEHITSLLRDDSRRIRLAAAGRDFVERFEWDRSAKMLESFLERYGADPVAYGRPPASTDDAD